MQLIKKINFGAYQRPQKSILSHMSLKIPFLVSSWSSDFFNVHSPQGRGTFLLWRLGSSTNCTWIQLKYFWYFKASTGEGIFLLWRFGLSSVFGAEAAYTACNCERPFSLGFKAIGIFANTNVNQTANTRPVIASDPPRLGLRQSAYLQIQIQIQIKVQIQIRMKIKLQIHGL